MNRMSLNRMSLNRMSLKRTKRLFPFLLLLFAVTLAQAETSVPAADGLVVLESPHDIGVTQAQLEAALREGDFAVVAIIDHAQNAAEAGLELRPTRVVIFGNPEVGTQLMQSAPTLAIDLPQRMLLWGDEAGRVFVAYNDPRHLAERHGLVGMGELLENVANALHGLAEAATAP